MNIIFRRCLSMLKLTEIKRDFYDPDAATEIPVRTNVTINSLIRKKLISYSIQQQHRLQIWPGYLTSIRQHESNLLLGVEIIHKVMRNETAMDVLGKCRDGGDFQVFTFVFFSCNT